MEVLIERSRVGEVAKVIKELSPVREAYVGDIFPGPDEDPKLQTLFFMAMVAIDHRTRSFMPYEAVISGKRYFGSELLYRKGMIVFEEDPSFFLPENLSRLKPDDRLLKVILDDPPLWDMHVRTLLLKDLGVKLSRVGLDHVLSDLKRLKVARAYEDPVEKKLYLLIKFLDGRGLIYYRGERHVAVDNHLTRLALRSEIVRVPDLKEGWEVGVKEDVQIRMAVREAWDLVAMKAGVDPFALDDFLWRMGREGKCKFCLNELREHEHLLTWYY